jgi:hypothetical protein
MRELRRRSRLLAPSRVVAPPAHGARIGVLSKRLNPTVNSRAAVTLYLKCSIVRFPSRHWEKSAALERNFII